MAEWRPARCRKIHGDFVDSRKLRGIGSHARAVLATAISSAWWDGESEEGRLYRTDGVPTTVEELMVDAEVPERDRRDAWSKLERIRVVEMRGDLIVLPRFRKHQIGDSAEKMREIRARERELPEGHRFADEPLALSPGQQCGIEEIKEALVYGWNGHAPPQPKGLPRLRFWRGIPQLLASGMLVRDVLTAIDEVAELVEAGELPATDWTSTKVFSGWLDSMRVKHAEWSRARARRRAETKPTEQEPSGGDFSSLVDVAAKAAERFKSKAVEA